MLQHESSSRQCVNEQMCLCFNKTLFTKSDGGQIWSMSHSFPTHAVDYSIVKCTYSTTYLSNQSILKEISPEYSLEELTLKLKLPILWLPDAKNRLTGKDPDAGKD